MSDLRDAYHRILKSRNLSPTGVSQYADALLDAFEERLTMEMRQVASDRQSQNRLADRVKRLEKGDEA
jgi:hypothetical protein